MGILHTKAIHGDIIIKTFVEKVPLPVENFLMYYRSGFYDNTIIHRVINVFMIYSGSFFPSMKQKKITQASVKKEDNNNFKNNRDTLAMVHINDPYSASAQFFINMVNNNFLNFSSERPNGLGYTNSLEVVDKIKGVATGCSRMHQDVHKEKRYYYPCDTVAK